MKRRAIVLIVLFLTGCAASDRSEEVVRVFAAASLTDAMEALADSFEVREQGRLEVELNVAGSSLLARQIEMGAEADVFVSAHPMWTRYLVDQDRAEDEIRLPIGNHLVVVSRDSVSSFAASGRIAVADPEHVPAGIYAVEALECEGSWEDIRHRIVPTIDVRAALAAVSTGSATWAIVYASDAILAPELYVRRAVSPACDPDIQYTAVAISPGRPSAERFVSFLRNARQRPTWVRYGFRYLPQ